MYASAESTAFIGRVRAEIERSEEEVRRPQQQEEEQQQQRADDRAEVPPRRDAAAGVDEYAGQDWPRFVGGFERPAWLYIVPAARSQLKSMAVVIAVLLGLRWLTAGAGVSPRSSSSSSASSSWAGTTWSGSNWSFSIFPFWPFVLLQIGAAVMQQFRNRQR